MHNNGNSNEHLIWKEAGRKEVFRCSIFSIQEHTCRSPDNETGVFTVLSAPDWAIVLPVLEVDGERRFVMVRQWRHGAQALSLEFPGGVLEPGESPEDGALRELREETAYTAGVLRKLGEFNPNPAMMSNRVHFFTAESLQLTSGQDLDADEYVDVEILPARTVIQNLGKPPYIHALMGTAVALYLARNRA